MLLLVWLQVLNMALKNAIPDPPAAPGQAQRPAVCCTSASTSLIVLGVVWCDTWLQVLQMALKNPIQRLTSAANGLTCSAITLHLNICNAAFCVASGAEHGAEGCHVRPTRVDQLC
jgi:hypothetical protein